MWKQWIEAGWAQRRAGIVPHNVTIAQDNRHLICTAVKGLTGLSIVLSRHRSTTTGVLESTVLRHLLRDGPMARMPSCRFPLCINHQHHKVQWARERRHWRAEWQMYIRTSLASNYPTIVSAYVLDAIMVKKILENALLSGIAD